MAYTDPPTWIDGSVGGTPVTAAALNLRDNNVRDHQTRLSALESSPIVSGPLLTRFITAPVTISYAASITVNAAAGSVFRVVAVGDLTIADIINGVDGQTVALEVMASGGARKVTVTGGDTVTVPAGQWWVSSFRFNSTASGWFQT